jgi:hypothetical protein
VAKLWIIGDSFVEAPADASARVWPQQVADRLGVELVNLGLMGTAQDWAWALLQDLLPEKFQPEDYLIVALTHPSRFWYFDDQPKITHPNLIDLDRWLTRDQTRAVESYVRYLQRPTLDILQTTNRMSYIAYMVRSRGLRRPLMIKCFDQSLGQAGEWPEFNWAQGTLMDDVQILEFDPPDLDEDITSFWHGVDGRYNHVCLSNHDLMADKVYHALANDCALDLKEGFLRGLINKDSLEDQEFVSRELNVEVVDYNLEQKKLNGKRTILPWKKRVGLKTGQQDD